jgi:acyl-ACP thioesterase
VKPEFLPPPERGRRFSQRRRVRLGDVNTSNRLRLDAIACYLQDVAADDVADIGVEGAWVLRRTAMALARFPRYGDDVDLITFCSGTGTRWAERRTTLTVAGAPVIDTVAIWVYVDRRGRPARLQDWFFDHYGDAGSGRRVSGRLHLPPPSGDVTRRAWPIRTTDFDLLRHMNNAAYWEAVEDEVARLAPGSTPATAELEHRAAIEPGEPIEVLSSFADGQLSVWITARDEIRAAAHLALHQA